MSHEQPLTYDQQCAVDGALHHWINDRQDERRKRGEPWEASLYEWKHAEQERRRLPHWLKDAFEGTLRTTHRQCSRSPVEEIAENRLVCALGKDVTTCPILLSLKASYTAAMAHEAAWIERDKAEHGWEREARLMPDGLYQAMASVCTWHIFTTAFNIAPEREHHQIDTSEGYVQDASDRRFWRRTYQLMGAE